MNRQDLINYKHKKEFYEDRINELEKRKELINKLTATYGFSVQGKSAIQDKIAENLSEILDATNEYANKLKETYKEILKIEEKLEEMPNKLHMNILSKVYLYGKNLTVVANEINKEYKYVVKLHGYALREFDKICKKK